MVGPTLPAGVSTVELMQSLLQDLQSQEAKEQVYRASLRLQEAQVHGGGGAVGTIMFLDAAFGSGTCPNGPRGLEDCSVGLGPFCRGKL